LSTSTQAAKGVLITGGTGYLGSYVVSELLRQTESPLYLLVRAKNLAIARAKLWRALQLHFDAEAFAALLPRLVLVLCNLHDERLGIAWASPTATTARSSRTSIPSFTSRPRSTGSRKRPA
jgi:nucleoside-diphosphate-sugar epimerase